MEPDSLRDRFDRRIDYLRVSVTDRCNLSCVYCAPEKARYFEEGAILTYEEIVRFVRIAHRHGLRKVRVTGGEPLLRKDISFFLSSIKEVGVPDLSLTTNGILLARMAGSLKEAGLDRVNISLDTLNPDKYRAVTRGGDIARIWGAIEEAEKAGLTPIKINMVPIKGINDDEIADFAALTLKKDYHIRFIELMPVRKNKDLKYVAREEIMREVSSLGTLEMLPFRGDGPSRNYRLKGAKGVIGFISPISDCFCQHCNRLRLTATGRIRPCLLSDTEIDIKTPMRKGESDKEVEELLKQALTIKPASHNLKDFKGLPSMSKIGG